MTRAAVRGRLSRLVECASRSEISAVRRHELEAVFWKLRIERQVDSAAFEKGKQANDRVEGAIEVDANQDSGADSLFAKEVRQAICAGVQLTVGDLFRAHGQRGEHPACARPGLQSTRAVHGSGGSPDVHFGKEA